MSAFYSFAVFERALTKPFRYGNETLSMRRGLLLRRHDDSGQTICSEASPLPGHSSDRLKETLQALEYLSSEKIESMILDPESSQQLPPALRFCLAGISAQLASAPLRAVESNGLLAWQGPEETRSQFLRLSEVGFKILKIKVMEDNAASIPGFIKSLPAGNWKIRLDGNRSLSPTTVAQLFQGLQHLDLAPLIDYFEEPLTAGWQHPLLNESPVSLAADESASSPASIRALLSLPCSPDVFVFKPTVLGGLAALSSLASELLGAGRRVVFTSALETEPGRRSILAHLARESRREVHGLATGFLFRENYLSDQPIYSDLPATSAEELSFLQRLDWRGCP
jgi:o-succinylbenzoate synthase